MINALFSGPSWLEQANQQRQKDMANYLQGGVPQLMADTGVGQDLAGGFAGTTTPAKGISAYHGSPYDFEKFDLTKIGTGEGAQAYGHGLYFAENPAVAEDYRKQLWSGIIRNIGARCNGASNSGHIWPGIRLPSAIELPARQWHLLR